MILILATIIIVNIVILSRLVFLPFPELFVYPYLANHGLLPYRDILDQHFPGLMFLPLNLDNLGMHTPAHASFLQYFLVAASHVFLFKCAELVFGSKKKALVANILFLFWQPFFEGWVLWIDSMLAPILLLSLYFLLSYKHNKKRNKIFLAGLSLGLALVFKQVVLPLAILLGLYLLISGVSKKDILVFCAGFVPSPALMFLYYFSLGIFKDFWYWSVTYNMTTFAAYGRKFATAAEYAKTIFVMAASFFGLYSPKFRKGIFLVIIYMIGALSAAYARFDFVHLQPALPFAAIGIAAAFNHFKEIRQARVFIFIYLGITLWVLVGFYKTHWGSKVYFFDSNVQKITAEVKVRTQRGEKIFIYGAPFNLYQMTETLPAGNVFVFQFPWFLKETEQRVLEGIEDERPNIVVADRTVTIEGQRLTEFSPQINDYISQNYHLEDKIGDTEILVKNK